MSSEPQKHQSDRKAIYCDVVTILEEMRETGSRRIPMDGGNSSSSRETDLVSDLEFESLDVVQFVVALEEHYQRRDLPFDQLLMKESGRYVDELARGLGRGFPGKAVQRRMRYPEASEYGVPPGFMEFPSMNTLSPTILIGMDGAAFSVLDSMMALGHMPFLREFTSGRHAPRIDEHAHPLTPPRLDHAHDRPFAGTSWDLRLLESRDHEHRTVLHRQRFPGHQVRDDLEPGQPAWREVDFARLPLMAPPPAISGVVVPGMLSLRHLRLNVHPREFYGEISGLPEFDDQDLSRDVENKQKMIQWMPDEKLPKEQLNRGSTTTSIASSSGLRSWRN